MLDDATVPNCVHYVRHVHTVFDAAGRPGAFTGARGGQA